MDNMIFLVEDGEVFEGTAQQLDDCFAITPQELKSWTASRGWDYVIRYDGVEIYNSAVHNDEKSLVERLGKQLGHGRVMELAQECWKDALERDWDITGGEFAIGPCVGMTTECGCECGCDWCGGSRWLTKHVKSIKDWNERDE